jgi:hypothetical protein
MQRVSLGRSVESRSQTPYAMLDRAVSGREEGPPLTTPSTLKSLLTLSTLIAGNIFITSHVPTERKCNERVLVAKV